jgi:hypothetical protein
MSRRWRPDAERRDRVDRGEREERAGGDDPDGRERGIDRRGDPQRGERSGEREQAPRRDQHSPGREGRRHRRQVRGASTFSSSALRIVSLE